MATGTILEEATNLAIRQVACPLSYSLLASIIAQSAINSAAAISRLVDAYRLSFDGTLAPTCDASAPASLSSIDPPWGLAVLDDCGHATSLSTGSGTLIWPVCLAATAVAAAFVVTDYRSDALSKHIEPRTSDPREVVRQQAKSPSRRRGLKLGYKDSNLN